MAKIANRLADELALNIAPFTPEGLITCNAEQPVTLWAEPVAYVPGAILNAGFSTAVPDYPSVKAGTADQQTILRDAPALVIWGYAFGGRAGDVMRLTITGPDGQSVTDHSDRLERDQAQFFRAAGRRTPAAGWSKGSYAGQVLLLRGEAVISRDKARRENTIHELPSRFTQTRLACASGCRMPGQS